MLCDAKGPDPWSSKPDRLVLAFVVLQRHHQSRVPYANAFYRRLSEMPNAAKLIGPSVDMETPLRHQLDLFGDKTAVLGCQR